MRWYSKPLGFTWHVDETYIKVKGQWKYLYRAVDSRGATLDFMLSHKRDIKAAKRFLRKALKHSHEHPCHINTDQNPAYGRAIEELKQEGILSTGVKHTQVKYLNNRIEADHRRIKRLVRPMLGFKSFHTAARCLKGIEAMAMMIKQQTYFLKKNLLEQIKLFNEIFGVYA